MVSTPFNVYREEMPISIGIGPVILDFNPNFQFQLVALNQRIQEPFIPNF